jgi:surfactin synthase thioesterase subunit
MRSTLLDNHQKVTLYCFPFAGGNSLSYREFQAHVADFIKVKPIDLPGHGKRARERLLTDLNTMSNDLLLQVQTEIKNQPYAIYGHSMGADLGYLLTRRIREAGLPAPLHLFFSGRKAPSVNDGKMPKFNLPKNEFVCELNKLGGCPPEVLAEAALLDFFEPILRADFQAIETYVYQPEPSFDIPMTIMMGLTDDEVKEEHLLPWQQETRHPISIKRFSGGHFFIFDHLPSIGQLISKTLAQAFQERIADRLVA